VHAANATPMAPTPIPASTLRRGIVFMLEAPLFAGVIGCAVVTRRSHR
jgi:hypothetical protein